MFADRRPLTRIPKSVEKDQLYGGSGSLCKNDTDVGVGESLGSAEEGRRGADVARNAVEGGRGADVTRRFFFAEEEERPLAFLRHYDVVIPGEVCVWRDGQLVGITML